MNATTTTLPRLGATLSLLAAIAGGVSHPRAAAAQTQPAAPTGGAAAAASRTRLAADHYVVDVALAPPSAVPGAATLVVEVRGAGAFHVNDQAPLGLDLQLTNATGPARLRATDAAQRTQQVAAFRVPLQVTAGGASVRGTLRAVLCGTGAQSGCEFVSREFTVAL